VRAGLELVAAVGALTTHATLQTRVGIATVLKKSPGERGALEVSQSVETVGRQTAGI
jgi:hypothetical protein